MKSRKKKPARQSASTAASKAFLESGAHLLLGEKLAPYTPSRIVAAQAMGLLYPQIGKEGMAQLKKTGIYPGELRDLIIVLWLCRLQKAAEVQDALIDPDVSYATAEKWAGKAGLCDMTSRPFLEALSVFQTIMNEIGESQTARTDSRARAAENDDESPDDPNG
jgi:hypothetical protein